MIWNFFDKLDYKLGFNLKFLSFLNNIIKSDYYIGNTSGSEIGQPAE